MSSRSRPVGLVAFLGVLVALVAGYLNDCFVGFGLSPGTGAPAAPAAAPAAPAAQPAADVGATIRIVVQGEQCRVDDKAPLRACEAVCAEQPDSATFEIEATAGAQRAVEALRACLQGRGAKVRVASE